MNFINPTYLWALLGLIVPIAIHLWSKQKVKVIKIGSIQFLEKIESKKARSIRFNELFLLFLRLLLLALLVLILANPVMNFSTERKPLLYVIEPSFLKDNSFKKVLDTLPKDKIRLLEQGFPEFDEDDLDNFKNSNPPNYWQLTKDFKLLNADSLVVFTKNLSRGLKGKRPAMGENVNWISLEDDKSNSKYIHATQIGDSLQLSKITSDYRYLSFEKTMAAINDPRLTFNSNKDSVSFTGGESFPISIQDTINVALFFDPDFQSELKYIKAALIAIFKYTGAPIALRSYEITDTTSVDTDDIQIWLSEEDAGKTKAKQLIYKSNPFSKKLIETGTEATVFYLTRRLNPENIVDKNLAEELLNWLPLVKPSEKEIEKSDLRTSPLDILKPTVKTKIEKVEKNKSVSLEWWLWLLFVITLAIERIVSKIRKQ
ncbi:BatA domain-containing protein [Galbibacter sp. BG1]|uniref:BatA domain-containing protein n=1 Tax=Galbibacter sp. BG1 TaxID=1170699 RepID=UPI0015BF4524|nr:BatA domain-containing protein [Galbibacter sp. BG1]QLE02693.1 BatA domain-containing protein [Galbibacter sp. BG1]